MANKPSIMPTIKAFYKHLKWLYLQSTPVTYNDMNGTNFGNRKQYVRLVHKGYVKRELKRCNSKKKVQHFSITDEGIEMLNKLEQFMFLYEELRGIATTPIYTYKKNKNKT